MNKNGSKYEYRAPELVIAGRIGVTEEAFKYLKRLKRQRKQSMAQIVSELILSERL